MVTSTLQTTLPYQPEQVWQVVTDLTDTAWRSDIARVERTGPGAFVEYTPAGVATRFTVTAQEPCRRWAFRLENSSLRGRWVGEFAPQGGGTRLRFTEEVQPKRWWMGPFVKGYLKGQQARYAGDLRRALETRFG